MTIVFMTINKLFLRRFSQIYNYQMSSIKVTHPIHNVVNLLILISKTVRDIAFKLFVLYFRRVYKVYPESVSFTFSTEFVADFGVEFPH